MNRRLPMTLSALLLAVLGIVFGPEVLRGGGAGSSTSSIMSAGAGADERSSTVAPELDASTGSAIDARVGFTSARALEEHFAKHGREFGAVTQAQYLRLAQELRDAPSGGAVREAQRDDRVITRFDTRSGAFLAFHEDRTIRTFFKPNDGLRYFERQLDQEH